LPFLALSTVPFIDIEDVQRAAAAAPPPQWDPDDDCCDQDVQPDDDADDDNDDGCRSPLAAAPNAPPAPSPSTMRAPARQRDPGMTGACKGKSWIPKHMTIVYSFKHCHEAPFVVRAIYSTNCSKD